MPISSKVNPIKFFPIRHFFLMAAIVFALVFSILVLPSKINNPQVFLSLPLDNVLTDSPVTTKPLEPAIRWQEEFVTSGDSLALIFHRVGLSDKLLLKLIDSTPNKDSLLKLQPKEKFRFGFQDSELKTIQYIHDPLNYTEISLTETGFNFRSILKEPEVRPEYKSITIKNSLFLSSSRAGIDDNITMEVANLFGGVIDFALDVRPGDNFDVLYEKLYLDDQFIGFGDILAASYTNNGKTYTAYRYQLQNGDNGGYFDADGISMRKPFLRAPLDFTRISSGFNLKRIHPIHKKIRAHRGIDYAAPRGTPVFSAGDGRVIRSGYTKANGNFIVIRHGEKYTTKYLHLHKRNVKTGQKVAQRDVIGTVGSTGYSTGPHLHYEFIVDGVHRNPRTIIKKLPAADPIPQIERKRFLEQIKIVQLQYANFQSQFLSEK